MNNKKLALILAITTLTLPLSGCTFINEVLNNDIMGKAANTVFDNENEMEKIKDGNSEVQKSFKAEKNRRELRERKEHSKEMKEDKKENDKSFLFRWK